MRTWRDIAASIVGIAMVRPLPVTIAVALLAAPVVGQEVAFGRDVLPILSDRCFRCHGPDAAARKAGLRLEGPSEAETARELVSRITALAPDRIMPPPDSNLSLAAAEVAILQRWVEAGMPWQRHWAYVAPADPVVPAVTDQRWPRSDLDRFVLAGLERRGIRPAAVADPAALLRRVTLDLTGLPPTSAELDAFVAAPSDAAYEQVVDRLLASPRYGERMAWPWLEAARYADTDGYQNDPTRSMWPWRDWLVSALNDNMPFDRFTVEALAGDLLSDATDAQVLASGFNRNHAHNGEGGRIAAETRVENVFDRTETTATVWMGLTFECARCHDHKFDPISQRDYYRMFAYFDQTSERGSGTAGRVPPTLRYLDAAARRQVEQLEGDIAAMKAQMAAPNPQWDRAQKQWATEAAARLARAGAWRPVAFGQWTSAGPFEPSGGDADSLFDAEFGPENGDAELVWRELPELVDAKPLALSRLIGATYLRRDLLAASQRELELSFGSDDAIRVWWNGEQVLANNVRRGVAPDQERVRVAAIAGRNRLLVKVVNTGGAAGFYFKKIEERIDGMSVEVMAALRKPPAQRDVADAELLLRHYRRVHVPVWRQLAADVAAAEKRRDDLRRAAPEVMVMDQLPAARRRTTRVLERGIYDRPREAVTAAVPAFLPSLPEDAPTNRLGLARWLTSGEHPLTARVAVNRAWQLFFGRGLVDTSEDFGRQGGRPSHPALLDWLALGFVESGWDCKALHRRIVTSATYRQSASGARDDYARDPDNTLLARASRFRLPAWMLRDQALALSGRLVLRVGGAPVRPYQPDGVWAEATFDKIRYRQDRGEALYRRSLYVFWRRIVGPTALFDMSPRQTCVVRKATTNSPLHALTTLNETAFVEAARGLAERSCVEGGDAAGERVAWAFRAVTARHPAPHELQRLLLRWRAAREHYHGEPAAAEQLLSVGEAARAAEVPVADLAAYTVVCSILLNLDEALTRP